MIASRRSAASNPVRTWDASAAEFTTSVTARLWQLGVHGAFAIGVEQKMPDGYFPPERDMREDLLHGPGRIDRLARAQVQQVDVHAVRFIGQVGGDPHREPFGVRRPRRAIGAQTRERAERMMNSKCAIS